jgi:hypothetical protein
VVDRLKTDRTVPLQVPVGPHFGIFWGFSDSFKKLSEKGFEQHLNREFGGYTEDEMGRKVRFSRLHRTTPRLARDFSDSFITLDFSH